MRSSAVDHRSDEQLVDSVRGGDAEAFGELWRRHSASGRTVASRFTSSLDADDLVSEAFASIYQNTRGGGGPTGPFRPYLYTTIRNLACTWGRSRREIAVDDLADVADPTTLGDAALTQLDSNLTAEAFRKLPARWQTVLWYTEVEGMDPHEVAPLLGLTPNGVAALAYRAREGLRSSWLQAHVTGTTASGSCRWTIERLGDHTRRHLGKRDRARMDEHLAVCARCSAILAEVDDVGARIAAILAPTLIGGGVGGGVLGAGFGHPSTATAAEAAPQLVAGATATLAGAPAFVAGAAGGASVLSGSAVALSALLVSATVAGSALVGVVPVAPPPVASQSVAVEAATTSGGSARAVPVDGLDAATDLPPSSNTIPGPADLPTDVVAQLPVPDGATGTVGEGASGVADTGAGATGAVDGVTEMVGGVAGEAVSGATDVVAGVSGHTVPGVVSDVSDLVGAVTEHLPPVADVVAPVVVVSPAPAPPGDAGGGIRVPLPGVALPGVATPGQIVTVG